MANDRRLDRAIGDWLEAEAPSQLPDRVLRATFERTRTTRQQPGWRVLLGRLHMNRSVPIGLGAAAVVVALVVGAQVLASPAPGGVGGAASAEPSASPSPPPIGGTVHFWGDGGPTTTQVDAVVDGGSVSGTAATTSATGTHTVRLECAYRQGDTWAFGGTSEKTTVPGERPGDWSAVVVRDGSPQRVGIWLSDTKADGVDCEGWLAAVGLADIGDENFSPVDSGALVPPPGLTP